MPDRCWITDQQRPHDDRRLAIGTRRPLGRQHQRLVDRNRRLAETSSLAPDGSGSRSGDRDPPNRARRPSSGRLDPRGAPSPLIPSSATCLLRPATSKTSSRVTVIVLSAFSIITKLVSPMVLPQLGTDRDVADAHASRAIDRATTRPRAFLFRVGAEGLRRGPSRDLAPAVRLSIGDRTIRTSDWGARRRQPMASHNPTLCVQQGGVAACGAFAVPRGPVSASPPDLAWTGLVGDHDRVRWATERGS